MILINSILFLLSFIVHSSSFSYFLSPQFTISTTPLKNYLAYATYYEQIYQTGWNQIHFIANNIDLIDQHRAFGYLQGYLTFQNINNAFRNYIESVYPINLKTKINTYINEQIQYINEMYQERFNQSYWQTAYGIKIQQGFLQQIRYMYKGYLMKCNQVGYCNVTSFHYFYSLTNMGDLQDLLPALNNQSYKKYFQCNSYIKRLNKSLYTVHSTYNLYTLMLRYYKNYQYYPNNPSIASQILSFSSRPGDLHSKDDFYILSSNLSVTETSLNCFNKSNYNYIHSNSLPSWLRVNIANLMAHNSSHWASLYLEHRSGTHNNQWIVVDYNKWNPDTITKQTVVMVQQYFYLTSFQDVTDEIIHNGYVASYNVPKNQEIYYISNYKEGYGYNYTTDPRAVLFKLEDLLVQDYNDIKKLIRKNPSNNKNLCLAIAPRCDLLQKDAFVFGQIDSKIVRYKNINSQNFLIENYVDAVSSPSFDQHTPFNWNKFMNEPSYGMPHEWNFQWIKIAINISKNIQNKAFEKYQE